MRKSFYLIRTLDYEYNEEEFQIALNDYKSMIDIFVYLINAIVENKIKDENWRYYAETLAIKFTFSANTLSNIVSGSNIDSSLSKVSTKIIDVSSLFTIMRAQIENYLTYFYLFIQPDSVQMQHYRFLMYELSGYQSRQKFTPLTTYTANKQKFEKNRINEIISQLHENDFFKTLPEKEQERIIKEKKAKLSTWNTLLDESKLTSEIFKKSWNLYSNFAHSEFASLMQVKSFLEEPYKTISTRNLVIFTALMLISVFIKDFCQLYREIEIRYKIIPIDDQEVIELFNRLAQKKFSVI